MSEKKAKQPAKRPVRATHSVYVIQLSEEVRSLKRFAAANPNARLDKPCLYVGLTGLTPE